MPGRRPKRVFPALRWAKIAGFGSLLCVACGSNKPELPAGVSAPESCFAPAYPEGPYGAEPGSVLRNACFQGFTAPNDSEHRALEPIALADFFDPDGSRGIDVLLVNTAAVWCSACRIEHETLPDHARELGPHGLRILSALFQNQQHNPANTDDLSNWAETFSTNFPMVLDPSYSFGEYASADTAPLNLVIDTRTMTLLAKYVGDQSAVMWPAIQGALSRAQ